MAVLESLSYLDKLMEMVDPSKPGTVEAYLMFARRTIMDTARNLETDLHELYETFEKLLIPPYMRGWIGTEDLLLTYYSMYLAFYNARLDHVLARMREYVERGTRITETMASELSALWADAYTYSYMIRSYIEEMLKEIPKHSFVQPANTQAGNQITRAASPA